MKVKKYKNGNIVLTVEKGDRDKFGKVTESIYHNDLFMEGLYLSEDTGTGMWYLADTNSKMVYDLFGYYGCYSGGYAITWLLDLFNDSSKIKLYPVPFTTWIDLKLDVWEY